tara:strand:- start:365 stop:1156 length:792 start_codon:yes stop_codon:yes gene_type:complete
MTRDEEAILAANRKEVYLSAISALERGFRNIEQQVPKPEEVKFGNYSRFRYPNQEIEAAIFLKLARLISLVKTLDLLLDHGRVQELCILQRSVEETNEDILFLSLAITENDRTPKHDQFLSEFWTEDYTDPDDPIRSRIPKGYSRGNVRSYINRALKQPDPSTMDQIGRSIYEMYSGFLHGSAPHIFELFDENTQVFRSDGIKGSMRLIDYILDAQNSFYRSLLSLQCTIKAFGLAELLDEVKSDIDTFVLAIGKADLLRDPK